VSEGKVQTPVNYVVQICGRPLIYVIFLVEESHVTTHTFVFGNRNPTREKRIYQGSDNSIDDALFFVIGELRKLFFNKLKYLVIAHERNLEVRFVSELACEIDEHRAKEHV
jgi:hypothetical protein